MKSSSSLSNIDSFRAFCSNNRKSKKKWFSRISSSHFIFLTIRQAFDSVYRLIFCAQFSNYIENEIIHNQTTIFSRHIPCDETGDTCIVVLNQAKIVGICILISYGWLEKYGEKPSIVQFMQVSHWKRIWCVPFNTFCVGTCSWDSITCREGVRRPMMICNKAHLSVLKKCFITASSQPSSQTKQVSSLASPMHLIFCAHPVDWSRFQKVQVFEKMLVLAAFSNGLHISMKRQIYSSSESSRTHDTLTKSKWSFESGLMHCALLRRYDDILSRFMHKCNDNHFRAIWLHDQPRQWPKHTNTPE